MTWHLGAYPPPPLSLSAARRVVDGPPSHLVCYTSLRQLPLLTPASVQHDELAISDESGLSGLSARYATAARYADDGSKHGSASTTTVHAATPRTARGDARSRHDPTRCRISGCPRRTWRTRRSSGWDEDAAWHAADGNGRYAWTWRTEPSPANATAHALDTACTQAKEEAGSRSMISTVWLQG